MIVFWVIVVVMVAIALAIVLPVLMGRGRSGSSARKALNVAIYKERFAELKTDVENGTLSHEQFELAQRELEQELLQDVTGEDDEHGAARPKRSAWAALVTAFALPALAVGLYLALGDTNLRSTSVTTFAKARDQQLSQEPRSVEESLEQLRARLQQQPNDVNGWVLLARSYIALDRYGESVLAFAKAHQLIGDDPQLLADYAEALALANGNRVNGEPLRLAGRALQLQSDNRKALWLLGLAAAQRGEGTQATQYWRRLKDLLPVGSQDAQTLAQYIAQAAAMTAGGSQDRGPSASASAPPTERAGSKAVQLQVQVALDPRLAERAGPDDTVFIFAQAAQGPRMPLAIVRKQVKGLPATVTLDDSMAMMPAMRLSQFTRVIVGARVSKSGQATPQSGDLEGRTDIIKLDIAKTVQVTINRVLP